jgi:hypothetical protein
LVLLLVCLFSVGIVTANLTLWRWMTFFALINRIVNFQTGLQAWWTTWRELWGVWKKKLSEPLPFGSTVLSLTRGLAENRHHRQSVSDARVPRYQLHHEDDCSSSCWRVQTVSLAPADHH